MSAQQKKLFALRMKNGAQSQSRVSISKNQTSRKLIQQRNSTKLPTLTQHQLLYSPTARQQQNTLSVIPMIQNEEFHKNTVKFQEQRSMDALDYRRYKIKTQDCITKCLGLGDHGGKHIFILNDGYGTSGLLIAKDVAQMLSTEYKQLIEKMDYHSLSDTTMHSKIKDIYRKIDETLDSSEIIDLQQSGTTSLTLLIIGDHLLCVNCGDSKALFYYKHDFQDERTSQTWRIKNLSQDHTPLRDQEMDRIKSQNGKIEQKLIRGKKQGQLYIWTKQSFDQGIRITRCFGSHLHKQVGVIVDPEFINFKFPKNGYLVIASSSLWHYLDNIDIGVILNKYNPPKSQSDIGRIETEILANANHYWDPEHEGIQDISLIVVYIDLYQ